MTVEQEGLVDAGEGDEAGGLGEEDMQLDEEETEGGVGERIGEEMEPRESQKDAPKVSFLLHFSDQTSRSETPN